MTFEVSLDRLGKVRIKPRTKLIVANLPIKSKNNFLFSNQFQKIFGSQINFKIFWFSNQFRVALAHLYVDTFLFPKHQQIPLIFFLRRGDKGNVASVFLNFD